MLEVKASKAGEAAEKDIVCIPDERRVDIVCGIDPEVLIAISLFLSR